MISVKRNSGIRLADLIRGFFLAWLVAVGAEFLRLPGELRALAELDGLAQMSFFRVIAVTCIGGALFLLVPRTVCRWMLAGVFAVLAVVSLCASFSLAFLGACILIAALLVIYSVFGWEPAAETVTEGTKSRRVYLWLTVGLAMGFFLFVSVWTVCRVYSFSTPTFDFGIFSQMFYHMKESGLPVTTVERDGQLSHFAVHMSPVYYLLLPFYVLAPAPATLQVLQTAVITSSVIPLWKLGKIHGLSGAQRMLVCTVLLLYPAFSGGTSYDIHENCFLTPLILWLFYGIDRKNAVTTAAAALLTLTVKEDAAVYVAVIALWLIVKTLLRWSKEDWKQLLTGAGMLAVALVWFFLVTGYLAGEGDGVMTYRYDNFIYDGSGSLVTVIKAVILSPMKAVYECVDTEKLQFLALTMLPLLGLPLMTRRYERYILLIPYLLVNLMSDYRYQHDVFFQYTFGSTACLLYLVVVNLAQLRGKWQRIGVLTAACVISAACFTAVIIPKALRYPVRCIENQEQYESIRQVLQQIPEEASVTATTFYTTYLSQRDVLYDVRYSSKAHLLSTEYVVLDVNGEDCYRAYSGYENLTRILENAGYCLTAEVEHVLTVWHK